MTDQRILVTHTGSLPRPQQLLELLQLRDSDEGCDSNQLNQCLQKAVSNIVLRQKQTGINIVNDGEMGRTGYANYISRRLSGFGGPVRQGHIAKDLLEYKALARRLVEMNTVLPDTNGASCIGEVRSSDLSELELELGCFAAAKAAHSAQDSFMTSASPGIISVFQLNEYYPDEQSYIEAVADAMRPEYRRIVAAGHQLQLDCPDLAMNRHLGFADRSERDFLDRVDLYIQAINHATAGIDPEKIRMHLCWGNYQGPHHHDVELEKILPLVLRARPATICLEAANPRHAHEWQIFEKHPLPANKRLIPGLIDTCTNYVEHPRWIAQRLCQFAQVMPVEHLSAGTDCGFSSFAGYPTVDPDVVWLKLRALAEGAELANKSLFG